MYINYNNHLQLVSHRSLRTVASPSRHKQRAAEGEKYTVTDWNHTHTRQCVVQPYDVLTDCSNSGKQKKNWFKLKDSRETFYRFWPLGGLVELKQSLKNASTLYASSCHHHYHHHLFNCWSFLLCCHSTNGAADFWALNRNFKDKFGMTSSALFWIMKLQQLLV